MQETGSNVGQHNRDLSTEFSLSGLSFSEGNTPESSAEKIEAYVVSLFGSCQKEHIYIYVNVDSSVTIVCYKSGLIFAETLPCTSSDDVLYYTSIINQDFDIAKGVIVVGGLSAEINISLLKRYFKQVVYAHSQR